jgi:hypothetical protein
MTQDVPQDVSQDVQSQPLNPVNWMGNLPNKALLAHITMPGTHESMSRFGYYSTCQTLTLTEQLNKGIRVFDIRVVYWEGPNIGADKNINFKIQHAGDSQNAFFDSQFAHEADCDTFVLDQCLEFLKNNSSETIVMLVKQEQGQNDQDRTTFFDAFWPIINNRGGYNKKTLSELFYVSHTVPILENVRGKIVFVFVDGDKGSPYQLDNPKWGLYWGNIDYQVEWDHLEPGQVADLDVENHWKDLMDVKWGKITAHLDKTLDMGPGAIIWCITYISASKVPVAGYWPVQYADYLLPKLLTYIQDKIKLVPGTTYFGTVMMDFPTENVINWLIGASLQYQYP